MERWGGQGTGTVSVSEGGAVFCLVTAIIHLCRELAPGFRVQLHILV